MENLDDLLLAANNDLKTIVIYLYTMIACSNPEDPDFCKNVKHRALTLYNISKLNPKLFNDRDCRLARLCATQNIKKCLKIQAFVQECKQQEHHQNTNTIDYATITLD